MEKLSKVFLILLFATSIAFAEMKPKKSYTVTTEAQGEKLQEERGFGDKEGEVRMMNLMMVEGSGYEGMDMSEHSGHGKPSGKLVADASTKETAKPNESASDTYSITSEPSSSKVGANLITLHVQSSSGKPVKGLKWKAKVYMTNMDMGTEEPKVKETKPGDYQVKAVFSMKGPWAVKFTSDGVEKVFNFEAGK